MDVKRMFEIIYLKALLTTPLIKKPIKNKRKDKAYEKAIGLLEKLYEQGRVESYTFDDITTPYEVHTIEIYWKVGFDNAVVLEKEDMFPLSEIIGKSDGFYYDEDFNEWYILYKIYKAKEK